MNDNFLETTDLCKYFGGLKAVKDVNFSVKKILKKGYMSTVKAILTVPINKVTHNKEVSVWKPAWMPSL